MILYLIPILTALTVIAAAGAVYQINTRSKRISARLHRVVGAEDSPLDFEEVLATPLPVSLKPLTFFSWLLPTQIYSETLKWELAQAGFLHNDARQVFAGARVLTTAIVGVGGTAFAWTLRLAPAEIAMIGLTCTAIGYFIPTAFMRYKQMKRQEEITLGLPDALDLLVICVEAGQGLNAAILKVARESEFQTPALSDELKMVNNEMRAGVTRTEALRNFSLRTGVDDVRAFVAVMIQSDRFGTSIAQALRIHAESLRTRRRQRAEERARKTPVKLVFPLVLCIFPALLVVILAPGMLQLFRSLAGVGE